MKPILCSTPMVLALLNTKPDVWPAEPIDGTEPFKSQTRRVIKPQPHDVPDDTYISPYDKNYERFTVWTHDDKMCLDCGGNVKGAAHWKPRYLPGDILWVRETWQENTIHSEKDKRANPYLFKADPDSALLRSWIPSIFMPRKAARLFLEVKAVRVERLQDITEADAKAEGINKYCCIGGFLVLWETLNAKRGYSWDSNPWVWVYEVMRTENFNGGSK